ncbi:hypothetical protein KP509_38G036900 [Ceratopteris richardii]|uniref:Uncharacterized protein n=1 Tax=Ceratopteris richardii TaxID=49495 RepID=A0A8T2Q3Y5_CERRI|nr:hypothetical protein KP509_38G036900 [Ceratopteris richardii]
MLLGKLTYGKIHSYNNKNDKNGQPCPASYPLRCVVPPPSKNDEKQKEKDVSKKTNAEGFEEQVRDAKIKVLASLSRASAEERKEWNDLATALKLEYPNCLKLLHEILIKVVASQKKEDGRNGINEVIESADQVINIIDKDAVAKFFGIRSVAEDPDAMKYEQDMIKQRDALVDALYKKGIALAELEDDSIVRLISSNVELFSTEENKEEENVQGTEGTSNVQPPIASVSESSDASGGKFEETYLELRKWVDISSTKYSLLRVIHEKRAGRLGTALKVLNELLEEEGKPIKKTLVEQKVHLFEKLGWLHCAAYSKRSLLACFPPDYPLF